MEGSIVGRRYRVAKKLGSGSFGEVYSGIDMQTQAPVAIKFEKQSAPIPQLEIEKKYYSLCNNCHIPHLHYYGTEKTSNVLIMDLMSKSVADLFEICHKKFTLKTILMLVDGMLTTIEYLHKKSVIHRDIKPDNFMFGVGNLGKELFIIDFGLAKYYRNPNTHEHNQYAENKGMTGTARYASVNSLKGNEQSRRDDLEALGYLWIYLLHDGQVPWMGIGDKEKLTPAQKVEKICNIKETTTFESLCEGFPPEFLIYMQKVRALAFEEEPDYAGYRAMFRDLFIKQGFAFDQEYDWSSMVSTDLPAELKERPRTGRSRGLSERRKTAPPVGLPDKKSPPPGLPERKRTLDKNKK